MSLDRFIHAQASSSGGFAVALEELKAGRKTSHWIWFVFPQLAGLGHSPLSRFYGLRNLDEAKAYLRHPELMEGLTAITSVVREQLASGNPLERLMGGTTDALKLVSSLTLFEQAAQGLAETEPRVAELLRLCEEVLAFAGKQGYPRCSFTRQAVHT